MGPDSPNSASSRLWIAGSSAIAVMVAAFVLLVPRLESSSPGLTLVLSALAGLATVLAVYRRSSPVGPDGSSSRWPGIVVLAGAAAYAILASVYSVNHHHNLGTTVFDFSIYDNVFYQTIHGKLLGSSLIASGYHTAAHFDPLLVLLSPLYAIYPRGELLLVLQSVWLASTAIPLYLLARQQLGHSWWAASIPLALLLHPALHGANFYDFHSLTLIAPLFIWAIYFLEGKRYAWYWAAIVLLLLAREDVSLLLCFVGLYALLGHRSMRVGLPTIVISLIYFAAASGFISYVAGEDAHSYAYYYGDLVPEGGGYGAIFQAIATRPLFVVQHVLATPKILFLLTMFVPVLLLPLIAPRGKILLVYGLAVILLASRPALYSVHFQYPSILYPAVFVLVPIALAGLPDNRLVKKFRLDAPRLTRALVLGMVVATALVSVNFGGLLPNATFKSGFGRFLPYATEEGRGTYRWVRDVVNLIPEDASVAASRHLAPHVSNRFWIHRFPDGWGADYLFIDREQINEWRRVNLDLLLGSGCYETIGGYDRRMMLLRRVPGVELPEQIPRSRPD